MVSKDHWDQAFLLEFVQKHQILQFEEKNRHIINVTLLITVH